MSKELVPVNLTTNVGEPLPFQEWQDPRPPGPVVTRSPLERPLAAIRRYKWLIAVIVVLASAGGIIATRFLKPQYEVKASIMLSTASPMDERTGGPIRSQGLLAQDDWIQLLKSFVITDNVVRKLGLYLKLDNPADSSLFRDFSLADRYIPGQYELLIDKSRRRWTLSNMATGQARDSGTVADSVGHELGFLWQVPGAAFAANGQRTVKFTVATPREISVDLADRLQARRPGETSNFLILSFVGDDRNLAAKTVNTWLTEYVKVAEALKTAKLSGFTKTLGEQFHSAKLALDSSEMNLQQFKVATITKPMEGAPIAAGLAVTESPVTAEYFKQQVEFDNTKHDIVALQGILKAIAKDSITADVILQVPTVANGGAPAEELRQAFTQYYKAQNDLAAARVGLQDAHPIVKQLMANVASLKNDKIPTLATRLLTSLKERARDDSTRIAAQGHNLEEIPQRTIEEERYRRDRDLNAGLFADLQKRYAEAQLAEASASPDVTILDTAIAPLNPAKNRSAMIIFGAIFGGLGAAIGLALLLDQLDGRLRYPEQASEELGLPIAGTVPRFPKGGADHRSPEQMFQLVESFRSLRMSVISNSSSGGNVSLAISSPSPGEGKSLISANLAMSFADAGLRTVLVDGDTRRGTLHEMFGIEPSPGLTDYLAGEASVTDILRPTGQDKLMVVPSGIRQRRNPELLASPLLATLVDALKAQHDVVIFDTPPLAAGIDAYSISVAAGTLLLVLRVGQTERRMAAAKMRMFERLPVEVAGAVLNGIELQGEYEYYGYVGGYAADEEPGTAVAEIP